MSNDAHMGLFALRLLSCVRSLATSSILDQELHRTSGDPKSEGVHIESSRKRE